MSEAGVIQFQPIDQTYSVCCIGTWYGSLSLPKQSGDYSNLILVCLVNIFYSDFREIAFGFCLIFIRQIYLNYRLRHSLCYLLNSVGSKIIYYSMIYSLRVQLFEIVFWSGFFLVSTSLKQKFHVFILLLWIIKIVKHRRNDSIHLNNANIQTNS